MQLELCMQCHLQEVSSAVVDALQQLNVHVERGCCASSGHITSREQPNVDRGVRLLQLLIPAASLAQCLATMTVLFHVFA